MDEEDEGLGFATEPLGEDEDDSRIKGIEEVVVEVVGKVLEFSFASAYGALVKVAVVRGAANFFEAAKLPAELGETELAEEEGAGGGDFVWTVGAGVGAAFSFFIAQYTAIVQFRLPFCLMGIGGGSWAFFFFSESFFFLFDLTLAVDFSGAASSSK